MATLKSILQNPIVKRILVVAGIIAVILIMVHIWYVQNARTVLKQYITEQSHGKIRLELSRLNISLLTRRLQIHEADLVSTDSTAEPITYHVTFSKLSLNVGSIWTLLFHKKLLLDSIKLHDPVIQVMQWRKDTAQVVIRDELSIPQEMGKMYNSLLTALDEFGVRRILIDNAKISLINKMKPGAEPVTVSSIYFDMLRTPVKVGNKNVYLQKDHSLELRSSHQHIKLPGGRHTISFKSFKLQLFRQRVDLDSCTVRALPTDSIQSNYRIFFKRLSLTGVDYNAMSSQNVIKADTVYCENPFFEINLYRSDAVKKITEIPDPNKIIRELTGNFNMAFVGFKNAGIHFNISGKTKQAFLNSNKDNFEMHGLRINPDSSIPVSIRRFDMTLRDYFLYNEDSSSVYSFDSLRFLNSRIILNDFAVSSSSGRKKLRNDINVRVPHFELSHVDWYQLIFEQNMVAREAVLNDPVINFTRKKPGGTGKKLDLFAALVNLDSLVALENVSVNNGEVNMRLGPSTHFNVRGIDFNVYSNKLLRSKNKEGVRSAVEHLSFSSGVLRIKDITAELLNARYTGNNLVYADKVAISGKENKIAATVNNVYIDNLQLDDNAETMEVDGLGWKSATVRLQVLPLGKKGNNVNIHLRNISGSNTRFGFSNGPLEISTFIQTLQASSLIKKENGQIRAQGFMITGNDLQLKSKAARINAASYAAADETSRLSGVQVEQISGHDTLNIRSSNVHISTKLNDLFDNNLHMTAVNATNPVIVLNKWDTTKTIRDTAIRLSPVRIDELTAVAPDISITAHRNDSASGIRIPRTQNSLVQASGIVISDEGLRIGSVRANTTTANYVKRTGEILGIEKGKIDMELSNILVDRKDDKIRWSGFINKLDLENANGFHLGRSKNNLRFHYASLGDLNLSSDYLPDFTQVMKANLSAWLRIPQGHFIDSSSTVQWYNAKYDNNTKSLSLDSFVYHPTPPLDSVLAYAPYQLDYITVKTGAVTIDGLDITRYEKDSSFIANSININNPVLTVFRDKKPPLSPFKKVKPLPVDMIKNISIPVSVQTIAVNNGTITYGEKNGESRKTGTLLLNNVNATLENIRNRNLQEGDSLSLAFNASLMEAADLRLRLKESYTDSLGGFLLTADISSADMAVLNPVLVPLLNIKIASGTLDSISLRAVGREDLAFGEMDMHYRKFRIRMIDNGEPDESSLVQNILSYIANAFIIKRNNMKRTGIMFHKRTKGQSFINYIMKTTVSGITSSIGVKTNRKYIKKYKQELKKSKNPAIRL